MGMDVIGRGGKAFRANVWGWRALMSVCEQAGFDVPKSWHFNDGEGLRNWEACEQLADLLERFLAENDDDEFYWDTDYRTKRYLTEEIVVEENPYAIWRGGVKCFVEFLRNCDGHFEIW